MKIHRQFLVVFAIVTMILAAGCTQPGSSAAPAASNVPASQAPAAAPSSSGGRVGY